MDSPDRLAPALTALEACGTALRELDAGCCDPGRSPAMAALAGTLDRARAALEHAGTATVDATIALLEDAGARVGRLQVGCCAPDRLPLYAEILEGLTTAQLALNRTFERGHQEGAGDAPGAPD